LWECDWRSWGETISVNLVGTANLMHFVLPYMIERRAGRIINIAGGGAGEARPRFSAYAAAKAGLVRLTETVAHEVRPYGVWVNAVSPGAHPTSMLRLIANSHLAPVPERERAALRLGQPADYRRLTACIEFLASERSAGLTGKFISAQFDPWQTWVGRGRKISDHDGLTLRRTRGPRFG
jgi:NAD(P)-dependent dehydrogenase (short-subunit alcohol dehydrogenase family)